jgi:DNA polymerase-4
MSIERIGQLRSLERSLLREMFGVRGEQLFERCRGRDYEPLRPDAGPKTISRETTFHAPTTDADEIAGMLFYLLERATRAVRAQSLQTGFVELSIRYDDWRQLSASRALPAATDSEDEIFAVVLSLLDRLHKRRVALRHVGLVLSRLEPAASQPILFEADRSRRSSKLQRTKDMIRDRYGHAALVSGRSIELMGKLQQNDYGFVLRTPSLTK